MSDKGFRRRSLLQLFSAVPIAAGAFAAPSGGSAAPGVPQTPALLKHVIMFIVENPSWSDDLAEYIKYQPILAAPSQYDGDVDKVISVFRHLYGVADTFSGLKSKTYEGLTVADLVSPEWDTLEKEWLPVVRHDRHEDPDEADELEGAQDRLYSSRHGLAKALSKTNFPPTTLLSAVPDAIEPRCIRAVHAIISQSYRHDPVGFVRRFHEAPANVGLDLHYFFNGNEGYEDYGRWIPDSIARHIEATFPFSKWGKGHVKKKPTGLNNRLFDLGTNNDGQHIFHIALSLQNAGKAMVSLFGRAAHESLRLQEVKGSGVLLTLRPDEYMTLGKKLTSFLGTTQPQEAPVPIQGRVNDPAFLKTELG